MEEMRNAYSSLVGKPEEKRPLGRPRLRWEDNTRIGMDWIRLTQDRDQWWAFVNMVMNLGFPYKAENFLNS
jgi:hypothetical protein